MKDKIIVTGGCGYIGSHTVIELIENDYQVVIVDDLSNSTEKTLDRIKKITTVQPIFSKVDLKEEAKTKAIFKQHKDAKAVIHFAAHKAVEESVNNPLKYYKNNLNSLLNVLHAQIENKIQNIIFSSSATVYGIPEMLPITEKNKTKRSFSSYGNTKKIAEEILEDVINSNSSFSAVCLRYFNPIGAHKSGLIGELPNGIPNNLMPYITQTAVGIREKLMVFGNDYNTKDGTPVRDYIHVVDLAKAHVIAVDRLLKKQQEKPLEVFNLGTGIGYSVLEIIQAFEKITQLKLKYEITDRRPGDIAQLYAGIDLAKEKLGWVAVESLESMIRSSWNWEKNLQIEKE